MDVAEVGLQKVRSDDREGSEDKWPSVPSQMSQTLKFPDRPPSYWLILHFFSSYVSIIYYIATQPFFSITVWVENDICTPAGVHMEASDV